MAIGDGKIGIASSNGLSRKVVDNTISNAVKFMKSGERDPDFEEIVSEIDKGIYVPRIPPAFINPATGSFSVELRQAFSIEKGEIKSPVRWGMISGNIYDMIKNIYSIGNDLTSINYVRLSSICFTDMRIEA